MNFSTHIGIHPSDGSRVRTGKAENARWISIEPTPGLGSSDDGFVDARVTIFTSSASEEFLDDLILALQVELGLMRQRRIDEEQYRAERLADVQ